MRHLLRRRDDRRFRGCVRSRSHVSCSRPGIRARPSFGPYARSRSSTKSSCLHLISTRGIGEGAVRKANKLFGSSNWDKAVAKVDEVFGPLDRMVTEVGNDALDVWIKQIVRTRGDIVHGRMNADADTSQMAIAYAAQLMTQLKLRVVVTRKHPFSDVFMGIFEEAKRMYKESQGIE